MKLPIRQYTELLVKYLKPQRKKVALLGLLLLSNIGLQLINPQILRHFIDQAIAGSAVETLVGLAALFFGMTLISQALSVLATYVSQAVGWTATNTLRADLAEHCLGLDMSFHKARTPGELIERVDGDVTVLANFFSQFVLLVLGNTLLLVGVLVVLWREDWRVGLALTAYALVALSALNRSRHYAIPYHIAQRQAHARMYGLLEERLAGLDDIRANGAGAYVARRFHELQRDVYHKAVSAEFRGAVFELMMAGFFGLGYVGALAWGAALFQAGQLTMGTIFLIVRYTQMLRDPMLQITRQLQDLQKASAGIVRASELFRLPRQIQDGLGELMPAGPLSVEFRDVSFEYADQLNNGVGGTVLHHLSFHLQPGKVLGLLGRTGSGKTTLTRLLARLYDPCRGTIHVGDTDIRAPRLDQLRRRLGLVTQDVQLFQATVRDNLTLFESHIHDERILAALDHMGLMTWYQSLPNGLDTELAPGGGLSAGEAQLLAFTRVLLKDPSVIILDEASSRLDRATERLIERAVDQLLDGRTGIIIAHRLATVQRADEIMILDNGEIVELGERACLASDPRSRFYQLLRTGMEEVLA